MLALLNHMNSVTMKNLYREISLKHKFRYNKCIGDTSPFMETMSFVTMPDAALNCK